MVIWIVSFVRIKGYICRAIKVKQSLKLFKDCRLMFSIWPKQPTDPIHFLRSVQSIKFTFLYLIPVVSAGFFVHSNWWWSQCFQCKQDFRPSKCRNYNEIHWHNTKDDRKGNQSDRVNLITRNFCEMEGKCKTWRFN